MDPDAGKQEDRRMRAGSLGFQLAMMTCLMASAWAAPLSVTSLGDEGWYSDDARNLAGVDLVGLTSTLHGKPGVTPTALDDAAIAGILGFVPGPGGSVSDGVMKVTLGDSNSAKSTASTVNLTGWAPASDLVTPGFSAEYRWYLEPNTTERTLAFRFGVQSTHWASSQTGFTAVRSGEPTWDLILVHIMATPVVYSWNTAEVDMNTGLWFLYGQATNTYWPGAVGIAPPAGTSSKSLAAWQADPVWGPVLFGPGAIVSSIQFGMGSSQRNCNAYVDYLKTSIYNGGDFVFFGDVPPVHNVTQDLYYSTIQGAVDDASSGDVVEVAAGTYEEQVVIDAPLTLRGAGSAATTIKSPTNLTASFSTGANNNFPVLYIHDTDGVVVEDLTVDGAGRGNANYRFLGIGIWNAGAIIEDCPVIDIRDTPFNGSQHGTAIYAYNPTSTRSVVVTNCQVSGYQKNGITINGASTSASITGCSVTGFGPTAITAQNGIQFSSLADGSVSTTTVTGNTYTPATVTACGLLTFTCADLAIEDSDFSENQTSVYVLDGDGFMDNCVVDLQDPNNTLGVFVYNTGTALAASVNSRPDPSPMDDVSRSNGSRSNHNFNISGCTFTGAQVPGSTGIFLYSVGNQLASAISDCMVSGWEDGIVAYEAGGTVLSNVTGCSIFQNTNSGMYSNTVAAQAAEGNWWGHATGPLDDSNDVPGGLYNPGGLGNAVSDQIDYDPWVTDVFTATKTVTNSLISVDDAGCPATTRVTFGITPNVPVPPYFGYSFQIGYPAALVLDGYHNNYDPLDDGTHIITPGLDHVIIDWVLWGNSASSVTTGDLFYLDFDGAADNLSASIEVTTANFRQHVGEYGHSFMSVAAGLPTNVAVDGQAPELTDADFPTEPCVNTDFLVTVSGTDNHSLFKVQYQFNTGSWQDATLLAALDGTGDQFFTSGVTGLGEGTHTIQVRYMDSVCNVSIPTLFSSWEFTLDTVAPAAPTNLVATPDHGVVHLSWTAGSNYTGYRLYGLVRDGYPYYNDGVSGGGNDGLPGVGDPISAPLALATFGPADPTTYPHVIGDRGVYDYQIEAFDCASNLAHSNIASSTNYFLGDWADEDALGEFDGFVCFHDVNFGMSAYYGLTTNGTVRDHMDVAPTSNNSAMGLPGPDHRINFEDLIIMAINYRISDDCDISPLDVSRDIPGVSKDATLASVATLEMELAGDEVLLNLSGTLMGYSAFIETDRALTGAHCESGLVMQYAVPGGYMVDVVALGELLDESSIVRLRFRRRGRVESGVRGRPRREQQQQLRVDP
jgi:nitrous oxidase accessory protein NosD